MNDRLQSISFANAAPRFQTSYSSITNQLPALFFLILHIFSSFMHLFRFPCFTFACSNQQGIFQSLDQSAGVSPADRALYMEVSQYVHHSWRHLLNAMDVLWTKHGSP